MKTKLLITLFCLSVIFSIFLPNAFGCSCAVVTDQEALESSVSSFIGTPIKIEFPSEYTNLVTFQIEKPVKNIGENQTLIIVRTPSQGPACGYHFDTKTKYLVHTHGIPNQSILETGLCSGNKNLVIESTSEILTPAHNPYEDDESLLLASKKVPLGGLGISFFNDPVFDLTIIFLGVILGVSLFIIFFYWKKRK